MTAVIFGIARIAGETAPVLFNAGGFEKYNWNPFSGQQDDFPSGSTRTYSSLVP